MWRIIDHAVRKLCVILFPPWQATLEAKVLLIVHKYHQMAASEECLSHPREITALWFLLLYYHYQNASYSSFYRSLGLHFCNHSKSCPRNSCVCANHFFFFFFTFYILNIVRKVLNSCWIFSAIQGSVRYITLIASVTVVSPDMESKNLHLQHWN